LTLKKSLDCTFNKIKSQKKNYKWKFRVKILKILKIITLTLIVNFISIFVHSANADTEDFESNIGVGPRSVISD